MNKVVYIYKPFVAVPGPYLGVVMCAAHAVTGHTYMTELMWSLIDNLLVIVTPRILIIVETRVMSGKGGGGSMGRRRLVWEKTLFLRI